MTPEEALRAFEQTTGLRVLAFHDRNRDSEGATWWREDGEEPIFRCYIGDRVMHIDELAEYRREGA